MALYLGFGILGCTKMKDGLEMTDVIPRGSVEYESLVIHNKYFGYYNIFIATKVSVWTNEEYQDTCKWTYVLLHSEWLWICSVWADLSESYV